MPAVPAADWDSSPQVLNGRVPPETQGLDATDWIGHLSTELGELVQPVWRTPQTCDQWPHQAVEGDIVGTDVGGEGNAPLHLRVQTLDPPLGHSAEAERGNEALE
eukprot:1590956-Lingulodinium_polyedra.AAC.1